MLCRRADPCIYRVKFWPARRSGATRAECCSARRRAVSFPTETLASPTKAFSAATLLEQRSLSSENTYIHKITNYKFYPRILRTRRPSRHHQADHSCYRFGQWLPTEGDGIKASVPLGKSHNSGEKLVPNLMKNPHDRELRTDTGWRIRIGRGLDIYQRPDSWIQIGQRA